MGLARHGASLMLWRFRYKKWLRLFIIRGDTWLAMERAFVGYILVFIPVVILGDERVQER
jgi:hypothetical protein